MSDKTCHIYIYGDIVNLQAKNAASSGVVSLTTVKNSYNADCDNVVVHIHSNGGSVFEGFAIHDFLVNTGKKVTTIVEGLCCSIATVIFLAGSERKLTENSRFLIHNPWGNGEGDAAYFLNYAKELQEEQKRLINFYRDQTGCSLKVLQAYMNEEKLMEPKLAVELKFATGIIDTVKAMAAYRNKSHSQLINNKTEMDKRKASKLDSLIAGLKNLVKEFKNSTGDTVNAAMKTLADDAGDVYFDGTLAEGTAVFQDEAMTTPCADGDYQFDDGTEITVADGLVTDLTEGEGEQEILDKTELENLRDEVAALKAEKTELENKLNESEAVMASATKALTLAKSTYRPDKRENRFNRIKPKEEIEDMADKMARRREELKTKKKR